MSTMTDNSVLQAILPCSLAEAAFLWMASIKVKVCSPFQSVAISNLSAGMHGHASQVNTRHASNAVLELQICIHLEHLT